jgi:hypothetical protein
MALGKRAKAKLRAEEKAGRKVRNVTREGRVSGNTREGARRDEEES